nr:hypothetical protein [Polynucleobacter necessarius]
MASCAVMTVRNKALDSSFDAWTKYYQSDENTPNAVVSYYGQGALLALGLALQIRAFTQNKQSLDDLMRLIWRKHGITLDGISEGGLDEAILELLGAGFSKLWNGIQTRYVFGVEDIPLQKWIGSNRVVVKSKTL